jgi:hypothetical protein
MATYGLYVPVPSRLRSLPKCLQLIHTARQKTLSARSKKAVRKAQHSSNLAVHARGESAGIRHLPEQPVARHSNTYGAREQESFEKSHA